MKIYISLPISGRNLPDAVKEAATVEDIILTKGHTPINPFKVHPGTGTDYADYLCADLRALFDADAILMLPGWGHSKGCHIEHEVAVTFDKRIFYIKCRKTHRSLACGM